MGLTAANSMPVQTQQMQGAPSNITQRASADILVRRKKKPEAPQAPASKPTADILMRRKK